MDKKAHSRCLSYQIMGRLWAWNSVTVGGNNCWVHRSYIGHLRYDGRL
jgi:hypothetical protein